MIERVAGLRRLVRERGPLVHCLTNHITINDCANVLLAVGAKPIMAEHPREVREITAGADALALNLGNITDTRMRSMLLSSQTAKARRIPIVLDLVGVGCSSLRLDFARRLVEEFHPEVVKGNLAEITALREGRTVARGVDARADDLCADYKSLMREARQAAALWRSVVVVSGPVDIVADPQKAAACHNGHPMLGKLTGTGCMLNALIAAFMSAGNPFDAALLAVLLEGVAGETAARHSKGIGSFRADFFDAVYHMTDEQLKTSAKLEEDAK